MIHIRDGFPEQRQIILSEEKRKVEESTPYVKSLRITDIGHFPETHYHFVERVKGAPEHILILNMAGKGWLRMNNKLWSVLPHHVAFVPALVPHAYGADDSIPWNIYWLHFAGDQADAFMEWKSSIVEDPVFMLGSVESLIDLFETAMRYSIAPFHEKTMANLVRLMHGILGETLLQREEKRQGPKMVEGRILKSIRHMKDSLAENLTLEELARVATLSVPHYSSLFKSHTGSSPLRFFTRLRLQKACELIEDSNQTVQSIAYELGFNDPFYFGRIFKKFIGVSPSQYRREILERQATDRGETGLTSGELPTREDPPEGA